MIPVPLMVNVTSVWVNSGLAVMLKLLAPGLKTIAVTSVVSAERVRSAILEVSKVATSFGPFGMVLGVQFSAVFQSLLIGVMLQVALSAWTAFSAPSASVRMMALDRMGAFMAPITPMSSFESKANS
jgi:hypothetical protein